jgi:hypothetical protein
VLLAFQFLSLCTDKKAWWEIGMTNVRNSVAAKSLSKKNAVKAGKTRSADKKSGSGLFGPKEA